MQLKDYMKGGKKIVASLMPGDEPATISCHSLVQAAWPHQGFVYTERQMLEMADEICERVVSTGANFIVVAEDQTPFFWGALERVAATYGMYLLVKSHLGRHPDFRRVSRDDTLEYEFTTGRLMEQAAA